MCLRLNVDKKRIKRFQNCILTLGHSILYTVVYNIKNPTKTIPYVEMFLLVHGFSDTSRCLAASEKTAMVAAKKAIFHLIKTKQCPGLINLFSISSVICWLWWLHCPWHCKYFLMHFRSFSRRITSNSPCK